MFYCDACAQKRKWPKSDFKSQGPCEVCGKVSECNEVKSDLLSHQSNKK